jgi:hypothetical protein
LRAQLTEPPDADPHVLVVWQGRAGDRSPYADCPPLFSYERRLVGRSRLAHFFFVLRGKMQRLRLLELRGFGGTG